MIQVEIYTHHNSMKNIMSAIKNELDLRLCCVQLIDCHYCSDPGMFFFYIFSVKNYLINKKLYVIIIYKQDLK